MVNVNQVEIKTRKGALEKINLEIGKHKTSRKEAMESPKKDGDAPKSQKLLT